MEITIILIALLVTGFAYNAFGNDDTTRAIGAGLSFGSLISLIIRLIMLAIN